VIDYSIRIDAPAAVVFEMLTDAKLLTEWMAAHADVDAQPGGTFRWVYENGDIVLGHFVEIDPPRRLVLAYGWELPVSRAIPPGSTRVEFTLEEADGATNLHLVHVGLPAAEEESHRGGWAYFLGRLDQRLAAAWRPIRLEEHPVDDTTNRLVDAYYTAWGNGDFEVFRRLLTDDFRFRGALDSADGPESFIQLIQRNAPMFGEVRFTDVRRVIDGARAVNMYSFEVGPATVPMAEAFEVRGDQIARIDLYFDPARLVPSGE
jgi:uncharacterized protein YndB with AHSA1/START domain/ketosteroid isomerase-like protein